jgi:peroxiredoxin
MLGLLVAVLMLVVVGLGIVLATDPPAAPLHVVTIPLADRDASPTLLRAAEAVGFEPHSETDAGAIESNPLTATNPPSASSLLAPGTLAPAFALRTPTGARVTLSQFHGKAVLLEFFATWCPHCDTEAPHLAALARGLPTGRYAFVGVDADGETAPSVLAYHIYFELPFPALLDPSRRPGSYAAAGSAGPVTRAYRISSYPSFYVLDGAGRVSWAAAGEQPDLLLRHELERAAGSGAG